MAEQASPRIALVYGDAAQIVHVREALADQVKIVSAAGSTDFDVAWLVAMHVQAVLVNLDGSDWLGDAAARLDEAGIRTVLNDPEISHKLKGWDQARWRRHLVAKLCGSTDFDPPRPASGMAVPVGAAASDAAAETVATAADAPLPTEPAADVAAAVGVAVPDAEPEPVPEFVPVTVQPNALERPLSPAEIESMSASFGVADSTSPAATDTAAAVPADADAAGTAPVVESALAAAPASVAPAALVDTVATEAAEPEIAAEPELDVDTAALSAMIDARLAEAEPAPATPPDAWRVVEDDVAPAATVPATEAAAVEAAPVVAEALAPVAPATPSAAAVDEVDVLQGMPALGDWQLVDPSEPIAPVAKPQRESPQAPASALDFAGLELVPMETIVPIDLHTDPIGRWMGITEHDKPGAPANGAAPAAAPEHPDGDRA